MIRSRLDCELAKLVNETFRLRSEAAKRVREALDGLDAQTCGCEAQSVLAFLQVRTLRLNLKSYELQPIGDGSEFDDSPEPGDPKDIIGIHSVEPLAKGVLDDSDTMKTRMMLILNSNVLISKRATS